MKPSKRSLIKISLIVFLTLFSIVYTIEQNQDVKTKKIENISIEDTNKHYQIEGQIIKQTSIKNNNFLTIKSLNSDSRIKGIIFNDNHTYDRNKDYLLEGKISIYNKEIEIIINSIIQI